jgi:hypothetical protein
MTACEELIEYINGPSRSIYGIENFTPDRRFAFWYVLSQLAVPGPTEDPITLDIDRARNAVTKPPDGGIDAIFVDRHGHLHLIQSKLHTTNLSRSEDPSGIEYLLRWAALLCDKTANYTRVRRGKQRLSGGTKDQLEDLRSKVLNGEIDELYLHFVSTRRMDADESRSEQEVPGREPLQVTYVPVGTDRVGYLFDNFMAGVPPIGRLTWRVARSSQQANDPAWQTDSDGLRLTHLLIPGDEIGRSVAEYRWQLFASNVRLDLGGENPVNTEIRASIRKEPGVFHLLNNGLTITCDESTVLSQAKISVEMKSPQIVNGQQTSWAMHDAQSAAAFVLVPVKLITIDRAQFGDGQAQQLITRLARATNRQSGINESDLRTNDREQIEIGHRLLAHELHYARKRGGVRSTEAGGRKVVSMMAMADTVGNCLWESIAHRNTKELLFTTKEEGSHENYYEKIFDPDEVRRNLTCFFLWGEVSAQARKPGGIRSNMAEERIKEIKRIRDQGKWLALIYIYRELGDEILAKADRFIVYGRTNKAERQGSVTDALSGVIEAVLAGIVRFYDQTNGEGSLPLDDITRFFKTADLNSRFTPFFRGKCATERNRFESHKKRLLSALK